MNSTWRVYGKHSDPPLIPEDWWLEVIKRTMRHAGAAAEGFWVHLLARSIDVYSAVDEAIPKLGPALLERFESDEGYRNFTDTIPCCTWRRNEK